jgi:hypothetical protein
MQNMHSGHAASMAFPVLQDKTAHPKSVSEAVIEFLLSSHTSLLDLAERKLGLFFGFSLEIRDLPFKRASARGV